MTGIQIITNPKICASCKAEFPAGSTMWLRKTVIGTDYYCSDCRKKHTWYVFDRNKQIKYSGLTNDDAESIVDELNAYEYDGAWDCAEDITDGTIEEA